MEYKQRQYPLFAVCGLNCGLCSRYHADGSSRCPGCGGKNFLCKHPSCGIISCCQKKNIEYCYLCDEYPCEKYKNADEFDSFITHRNQLTDFEKVKIIGLDAYKVELNKKVKILQILLKKYDDGRRKSFFCLAVNLLDLHDIQSIFEQIVHETNSHQSIKIKAAIAAHLFQTTADKQGIMLKLRKK